MMSEIDNDFDENYDEEDKDAKLAEEAAPKDGNKSLEKRRLIDTLLEEKRLARELEDFDDFDEHDLDNLDDDDFDDLNE